MDIKNIRQVIFYKTYASAPLTANFQQIYPMINVNMLSYIVIVVNYCFVTLWAPFY